MTTTCFPTIFSKPLIWLVAILLIFVCAPAQAQVPIDTLKEYHTSYIDLNNGLLILEDAGQKLGVGDFADVMVAGHSEGAGLKPKAPLSPKSAYWALFQLYSTYADSTDWILETGGLDLADLYIEDPQGRIVHKRMGRLVPASQKDLLAGDYLTNKFRLRLASHTNYTCYLRLANPTQNPVEFNVQLYTQSSWLIKEMSADKVRTWFVALTIGFCSIMLLYNFLIYLLSLDKVYLYYSAYIVFPLLYIVNANGLFAHTFLGEYPLGYLYTRGFAPAISIVFYMMFMRLFLNTKVLIPKWDKFVTVIIISEIINIIFLAIATPLTMNEAFFRPVSVLIHLFAQLSILTLLVVLLLTKDKLARYFVIGAGFFIGSAVFFAYAVFTKKVSYEIGLLVQTTGIWLELTTFSLGLGYRIRLNEKEKLAAQQENARILERQNQILEQKVKERTVEIEKQKEEIMTQNEELYQQQEEIIAQRDYIESQNGQLREQNGRITDSIRYAQTIQQATLPLEGRLAQIFDDYFVLYRPKDIVSGDFYWLTQVGNKVFLAVVDCTGHGVPGAFMSIMGATLLDDIITKEHIHSPAAILEALNDAIQFSLRQNQKDGNRDGMDLCLCLLENISYDDKKRIRVTFAGAKRPLYYFESDRKELKQLKGDRRSIGGLQKGEKAFHDQEIVLEKGSVVYLMTDGLADQHNEDNRKIGSLQVETWFEELKHLPLEAQQASIAAYLDAHQGEQKQRDDITLLGVQI